MNSFGYGGTNAHAILEDRLPQDWNRCNGHLNGNQESTHPVVNGLSTHPKISYENPCVFLLSASSTASLLHNLRNLKSWLLQHRSSVTQIQNLAYTLAARRSMLLWRTAFVAKNHEELMSLLGDNSISPVRSKTNFDLAFVFTGQGAQWYGMGSGLMKTSSAFRNSLELSNVILKKLGASWDLIDELTRNELSSQIDQSSIGQPASTAIQVALVDFLADLQVKPKAVIGHSSGEIAAAYASGAISQEAAIRIAYTRGSLGALSAKRMGRKGSMLAVGLGESEISAYLPRLKSGTVSVACVNSPSSTTISGDEDAILELKDLLTTSKIFARQLKVDTAYHSHHIRQVADDYFTSMEGLKTSSTRSDVEYISAVTGQEKATDFGPSYWIQNLVSPVRFSDGFNRLCASKEDSNGPNYQKREQVFIEIGPHSALAGPIRQIMQYGGAKISDYTYIPTLVRNKDAHRTLLEAVGKLAELGLDVDLERANSLTNIKTKASLVTDLQPYSWDHSRTYWHESNASREYRFRQHKYHELLGSRIPSITPLEPLWRNVLSTDNVPWLREHVVNHVVIFPASAYLCMAIEAGKQLFHDNKERSEHIVKYHFKDVSFLKALEIPEAPRKVEIQLALGTSSLPSPTNQDLWGGFSIYANTEGVWHKHCTGFLMIEIENGVKDSSSQRRQALIPSEAHGFDDLAIATQGGELIETETLYQELRTIGNDYGPNFAQLQEFRVREIQATASLRVPDIAKSMPANFMSDYVIHPTTMDALFHSALPLYMRKYNQESIMIISVDDLTISAKANHESGEMLSLATSVHDHGPRRASVQVTALPIHSDQQGAIFQLKRSELRGMNVNRCSARVDASRHNNTHQLEWRPDVDFVTADLLQRYIQGDPNIQALAEHKVRLLNKASSIYLKRCLDDIDSHNLKIPDNHLSKLVTWMRHYLATDVCQQFLLETGDEATEQACLDEAWHLGGEGETVSQVGSRLTSVVTGKVDTVSIFSEHDLFHRLYHDDLVARCCHLAAEYFRLYTFKNPAARVIEVGAGSGSATLPLLQSAEQNGKTCIELYDFTDISSGFFERGKQLLERWSDKVAFRALNVENDPVPQGFEPASYDCVVAANVLHATCILKRTLSNIHKLLKPGGRLILIEVTKVVPAYFTTFGTLPGWWLGKSSP